MGNCCSANDKVEKEYRIDKPVHSVPKGSDMSGVVAANWAWIKVEE